jgi:antitoxin component of MazEF toxin-antitoxin module
MEQFKIAKWGNSYAIRIPSSLMKELGLKEGDPFPREYLSDGAALRAGLEAERERSRMTREAADAVMEEARRTFPKDLRPEDWKIDRNDPDMRG